MVKNHKNHFRKFFDILKAGMITNKTIKHLSFLRQIYFHD